MDASLFNTLGQIAGIGGIALGVVLLLFREVIRKNIFPALDPRDAYKLIRLIVVLVFFLGFAGIGVWAWSQHSQRAGSVDRAAPVDAPPIAATVVSKSMPENRNETVRIDFDQPDTSRGPVVADDYLRRFGISVSDANVRVVILRDDSSYKGLAFAAPSTPNVLTQTDCNGLPLSFTLRFDTPVYRVTFRRAKLLAVSPSGVSHPAWVATAFDPAGIEIRRAEEHLIRNVGIGNNEPARLFTLDGPNIASVRFDSDYRLNGKPFAGFCGVLLDDLTLSR